MAKCELEVVLKERDAVFRTGDRVEGVVVAKLDKSVTCKRLRCLLQWRTHGRGNRDSGTEVFLDLFSGDWLGDRSYEYPFEFTVPEGPPTYHGHFLNIDWYVLATADIPWALDPKAEAEFRKLPGEPQEHPAEPFRAAEPGTKVQYRPAPGDFPKWAGCAFAIPILALFVAGGFDLLPFEVGGFGLFCMVGALATLMAGSALVFVAMRNKMAAKKLGQVDVTVSDTRLRPGESFSMELRFGPKEQVDLRPITAVLVCYERCISGSGTNQTTHTHEVSRDEIVLREAGPVRPPEMVDTRAEFTIPDDAPPSFSSGNANSLIWYLQVRVDVPRWPDWSQHVPLTVDP